jgi:hypothetical protein
LAIFFLRDKLGSAVTTPASLQPDAVDRLELTALAYQLYLELVEEALAGNSAP